MEAGTVTLLEMTALNVGVSAAGTQVSVSLNLFGISLIWSDQVLFRSIIDEFFCATDGFNLGIRVAGGR